MPEWFRDPMWNFIAVIVALLVALCPALFLWLRQHRKELSWDLRISPLVIAPDEEDVAISYKGRSVRDVHLGELKLINTGNVSIEAKDFERPLTFDISGEMELLHIQLLQTVPTGIPVEIIDEHKKGFTVKPLLLNAKDTFTIKLLGAGSGSLDVTTRILDVTNVKTLQETYRRRKLSIRIFTVVLSTLAGVGCGVGLAAMVHGHKTSFALAVAVILSPSIATLSVILQSRLERDFF